MAFKVQIVNINENYDNIILTNGLTIERLKIKYNWILNANVKNCILGEDEYGLIWYSGEWICGEWMGGTWYQGIWHDGVWNKGEWFSYLVDKAMIISNRFVVLDKSNTYSEFRSGTWKSGNFYNGTFGYEPRENWGDLKYNDLTSRTYPSAFWETGNFYTGIFIKSIWYDGTWLSGDMINSYWLNGKFYSGNFNHHNPGSLSPNWYGGNWYGGDFVEGIWNDGYFDRINNNIPSRFGLANNADSKTYWYEGTFINGEFHSGLNVDSSGKTLPSINNGLTHWFGGNFIKGDWYGGHFHYGNFNNGNWYNGVFHDNVGTEYSSDCIWNDGEWFNGLWINGTFYNGHFYDGMWLDGQFINGYLSTNITEGDLLKQILATNVSLPSVTATTITSISVNSAVVNGRVTNNGGATILDRGVCYTNKINADIIIGENDVYNVTDYGTMGNISITISNLLEGTTYYIRAYARNITGITYSNTLSFNTEIETDLPVVATYSATFTTSSTSNLNGIVTASLSVLTDSGFYYSSTNPNPGINDDKISYGVPTIGERFTVNVTGLIPLTLYYFTAYAENTSASSIATPPLSFTTPDSVVAPVVTTNSVINIMDISAVIKGSATNGGDPVITIGVCWSTSQNPVTGVTIPGIAGYTTDGITGDFTTTITNLTQNTKYYVKAYAVNSIDITYGNEISFLTLSTTTAPTVIMISGTAV